MNKIVHELEKKLSFAKTRETKEKTENDSLEVRLKLGIPRAKFVNDGIIGITHLV